MIALLAAAIVAQAPGTAARPQALVVPFYRVHVHVDDDSLDPDTLASLARPGVVLWVSTHGKPLRASTIERLSRFREAYVEMRLPLREHEARLLRALPNVGAWVSAAQLDGTPLPVARVAVDVSGHLDSEQFRRIATARPSRVELTAPDLTLNDWAMLAQLPGSKSVALTNARALDGCSAWNVRGGAARISLRIVGPELPGVPSDCPVSLRVRWPPGGDVDQAVRWLVSTANAELETVLFTERSRSLISLLDRLDADSPMAARRPSPR